MPKKTSIITKYITSLIAVVIAYLGYTFTVVPLIGNSNSAEPSIAGNFVISRSEPLDVASLFPPDSWERDCKILQMKQGYVLFKDYLPHDNGNVDVKPLTMVFPPNPQDKNAEKTPPIIMRAPAGAVLKFDRRVSIGGGFGKLEKGRLEGDVVITRAANKDASPPVDNPKAESFELRTSNVFLTHSKIYANSPVVFSMGTHRGAGKNLMIDLEHPDRQIKKTIDQGQIRRIELQQLDYLQIDSRSISKSNGPAKDDTFFSGDAPVRVTCRGPLSYDIASQMVALDDDVHALRMDSAQDELRCATLRLFMEESKEAASSAKKKSLAKVKIRRAVALGTPAKFNIHSRKTYIQAPSVAYDIVAKVVFLEGGNVVLQQESTHMSAQSVRYRITDDGSLGDTVAIGPGEIIQKETRLAATGSPQQSAIKTFRAKWKEKLLIRPYQGKKTISLYQEAFIQFDSNSWLSANELHLWMNETRVANTSDSPTTKTTEQSNSRWNLEPSKLVAQGSVRISSPQLTGQTKQLIATWQNSKRVGGVLPMRTIQNVMLRVNTLSRLQDPARLQDPPSGGFAGTNFSQNNTAPAKTKLNIAGDKIQIELPPAKTGKQKSSSEFAEFEQVVVTGNVYVTRDETDSEDDQKPLTITGDKLKILPQGADKVRVEIHGSQRNASFAAQGLELQGNPIFFDQSVGRVWVQGTGQIEIDGAVQRSQSTPKNSANNLAANANSKSSKTKVNWSGGMVFDGQQIYFEQKVIADARQSDTEKNTASATVARAHAMTLVLNKPVDLSQNVSSTPQSKTDKIEIDRMILVGLADGQKTVFRSFWSESQSPDHSAAKWVTIENKSFDDRGQIQSVQTARAKSAVVYASTGDITAPGPGSIAFWQSGKSRSQFRTASSESSTVKPKKGSGLTYTQVNFDQSLRANSIKNEMIFDGRVRAIHGPVAQFGQVLDPDAAGRPTGEAMLLTCNQLTLNRWQSSSQSKPQVEMNATGNTTVIGELYSARGTRISYNQAGEMVLIEGRAPSYVRLEHQPRPGSKPNVIVAETIKYYLKTNTYNVENLKEGSIRHGGR